MKTLYATGTRLLAAGEDVVLATIMSKGGSAPQTAGAKMLVRRDGSLAGTIGGGLMESMVLDLAKEVFQTGCPAVREFQYAGNDDSVGVCGGRLKVFVDFLSAGVPGNAEIFRAIGHLLTAGQKALLATELPAKGGDCARLHRILLLKDGSDIGSSLSAALKERLLQGFHGRAPQLVPVDGENYLVEPISLPGTVYLFGAGHVAEQVARLAATVNFRVAVLDDRAEFANWERFPEVDEITVLDVFEGALRDLPISRDSYLVIVTRGHQTDETVLAQALQTGAGYIGMMGSIRKRNLIYRRLREAGVTDELLAKVHSPIGLLEETDSPAEIAVSIVAELIKARSELAGG